MIILAMVLIWVAVNPNLTDMLASKSVENENTVTVDEKTNAITINGHTIQRTASGHPIMNPGGNIKTEKRTGIGEAMETVRDKFFTVTK